MGSSSYQVSKCNLELQHPKGLDFGVLLALGLCPELELTANPSLVDSHDGVGKLGLLSSKQKLFLLLSHVLPPARNTMMSPELLSRGLHPQLTSQPSLAAQGFAPFSHSWRNANQGALGWVRSTQGEEATQPRAGEAL